MIIERYMDYKQVLDSKTISLTAEVVISSVKFRYIDNLVVLDIQLNWS